MDGEDVTAAEFQERLNLLKAIGDPIFFRFVLSSEEMMAFDQGNIWNSSLSVVIFLFSLQYTL